MADDRTYIRLHDGMPDHPKVESLSDRAFRLLVETWCWCSRHLTDGRVPAAIWAKRGTPKARRELLAAGLVQDCGDHFVMHDYLEHQRSAEQVRELKAVRASVGTLGSHKRWHKTRTDPKCPHCKPVEGSHVRSAGEPEFGNESNLRIANDHSDHRKNPSVASTSQQTPPDPGNTSPPADITHGEDESRWQKPWQKPWQTDGKPMASTETETELLKNTSSAATYRPVAINDLGRRAVAAMVSTGHPAAIRRRLAEIASGLFDEGIAGTDITAALAKWVGHPNAGPALLPALVSDVIRERNGATRATHDTPKPTLGDKAADWLALANQPHPPPLRALPGGAQ